MSIPVSLTWYEATWAANVGVRRQLEALRGGRPDRHGAASENGAGGWTLHIDGAGGELAVAKMLGRYWDGSVNTYSRGGDVGVLQVRTRSKPHYELIFRPEPIGHDSPEDRFVLVTGAIPNYLVVGWIDGSECIEDAYKQDYGGHGEAYFVPHAALHKFNPKGSAHV